MLACSHESQAVQADDAVDQNVDVQCVGAFRSEMPLTRYRAQISKSARVDLDSILNGFRRSAVEAENITFGLLFSKRKKSDEHRPRMFFSLSCEGWMHIVVGEIAEYGLAKTHVAKTASCRFGVNSWDWSRGGGGASVARYSPTQCKKLV